MGRVRFESLVDKFHAAVYRPFCSTMGKSRDLHCEVQLLDDQSTIVDLDVRIFFVAKARFSFLEVVSCIVFSAKVLMIVCVSG